MNTFNFFIYSNDDFTLKSAGTTRMIYYAKILADKHHKVYLLSCCKNKITENDFQEIEPNIFIQKNKILTKNFFKTIGFLKNLFKFSRTQGENNVFLFYPPPLVSLEILSIIYLKLIKKQKLFFENNEIRKHSSSFHAPITFRRLNYSLKKIIFKSVFSLTPILLKFYDGLVCISTNIEKYGKKYNKNTIRIPILTNPDYQISKSNTVYFEKNKFNIGFSGSIAISKENLDMFIKVISRLSKNGYVIHFNLCGSATKTNDVLLKNLVEEYKLNSTITYYGNLNEVEFSTFLNQQDLLVIPRGYTIQNHYGFSTKLSDYLNHKKMILITDISDNSLYIKDKVNGFIVPPDDEDAMYNKLIDIIDNFDFYKKTVLSKAFSTSKEEFNYLLYKKALVDFLKN